MFWAIISTFLESISDILWKRSLKYSLPENLNTLFGYITGIFIVIYFIYVGMDFKLIDFLFVGATILFVSLDIIGSKMDQRIYKEEKISAIMPYENINKILSIIVSFFLFSDVSLIALAITILAAIIITLFSIDLKNFRFPKKFHTIFFVQCIWTITTLIIGYLVIKYGEELVIFGELVTSTIILVSSCLLYGYFKKLKNVDRGFWIPRITGSLLGWLSYVIGLFLISELGLSITILLSFLGMGVTLVMSYLFLGDRPEKKDLILTIIVTLLVGLGFYLK